MEKNPESEYPLAERLLKRFRPIWRVLLISNFALAAYIFAKASPKDPTIEDGRKVQKEDLHQTQKEDTKASEEASLELDPTADILIADTPFTPHTPPEVKQPLTGDQQRELFQWILDEKRKVKPKDSEEKEQVDDEKAVLKRFIRAESILSDRVFK